MHNQEFPIYQFIILSHRLNFFLTIWIKKEMYSSIGNGMIQNETKLFLVFVFS